MVNGTESTEHEKQISGLEKNRDMSYLFFQYLMGYNTKIEHLLISCERVYETYWAHHKNINYP